MTPESYKTLSFDVASSCYIVIIGGKYLDRISEVMEKVNSASNDLGRARPQAVFLVGRSYRENVNIDLDYGFDRLRSTPVMVRFSE